MQSTPSPTATIYTPPNNGPCVTPDPTDQGITQVEKPVLATFLCSAYLSCPNCKASPLQPILTDTFTINPLSIPIGSEARLETSAYLEHSAESDRPQTNYHESSDKEANSTAEIEVIKPAVDSLEARAGHVISRQTHDALGQGDQEHVNLGRGQRRKVSHGARRRECGVPG